MRTLIVAAIDKAHEERLWKSVTPEPNSGCWLWTAGVDRWGYGQIRVGERCFGTHRVAWTLARGLIPTGMHVLHRCDNPPCCNPEHLFLGTNGDNARDRHRKGRTRTVTGERHGLAKLTVAAVLEMRARFAAGESKEGIARRFGVSARNVFFVVNRLTWAHVGAEPAAPNKDRP